MDPNIILSGRSPDVVGSMGRGNALAMQGLDVNRAMRTNDLYRTQGAGILGGDPNALNALAGIDPSAAMDMKGAQQKMAFDAETMQMARDEIKAKAAELLKGENAAAVAAQIADEDRKLRGLAPFFARGDQQGYAAAAAQLGLDVPFEQYEMAASMADGVMEVVKEFQPQQQNPSDRFKVVGSNIVDLTADGGPTTILTTPGQEEIVYGPDGKPILSRGPAGSGKAFTEGQSKDVVFATRAQGALEVLDPVADALVSRGDRILEKGPMGIGREWQEVDFQLATQAGNEFLQAILRKDTGAAITDQEQALYGVTYLPQPGDNPEVLDQKKASRARAVEALKAGMSPTQIIAQERALMKGGRQAVTPAQSNGPQSGFTGMTREQLSQVDISSMSAQELDAYEGAWNAAK